MKFKTIAWNEQDQTVTLLDQTLLPNEEVYESFDDYREVAAAIKDLKVRGAPAIGVTAAYGVVVGMQHTKAADYAGFVSELNQVIETLAATRPTAVNLFWALERMRRTAEAHKTEPIKSINDRLKQEALAIQEEDRAMCNQIGIHGSTLLDAGNRVLTHCNAGALATAGSGTALAAIYQACKDGKNIHVYADETRPILQGARLTTWELHQEDIDVTLICDNMAAQVMKEGRIDCVITGADRIAANGDAANKIGTYGVAVLAKAHNIPMYVAAPFSTIDLDIASGEDIPIEERSPSEINAGMGKRTALEEIPVYNPAFDVTPANLISAIITERGIARYPFVESLAQLSREAWQPEVSQ